MDLFLLYAAVFMAGLILFDRLIRSVFSFSNRGRSLNRRLRLLEANDDQRAVYQEMLRERAVTSAVQAAGTIGWLRRIFSQSGIRWNPLRMALYAALGAVVLWLLLGFVVSSSLIRLLTILLLMGVVPLVVVMKARSQRMSKFMMQLPNALDVINRSLSSGHPLPTAIALVSRELPDPVGTEFGILSDELTYGTDLDHAMLNMVERVGAEDLKLLAVSMSVQRGTGGNFVEILENLSNVIRERAMLKAKVRALSAEGRITALVMSGFPFGLFFMINTLSPTYFDPVWASGYANHVIAAGIVIMLIGNYVLYKLVHFDF